MLVEEEIVNHVDEAYSRACRFDDPYLMYYFKPFPDHVYRQILNNLPDSECYLNTKHPDAIRADGTSSRLSLVLKDARLNRLPASQRAFWCEMNDILRSDALRDVFTKWHAPALTKRFEAPLADISAFPLPMLIRDFSYYKISVHPDTPDKVITAQMYLPPDETHRDLGTGIYGRGADKQFYLARKLEFMPNAAYSFAVTKNSWHGVETLAKENIVRNSIMLIYYREPHDEY